MNQMLQIVPSTPSDALTTAAATLQLELISPQSRRAYEGDTRVFAQWLASQEVTLEQINYDVMLRYHAYLLEHYAKATAGRRFVVARRLLEVAVKKRLIPTNPAADVKSRIRVDDSSPHVALTKREARKLLGAVDRDTAIGKRDFAMLLLLIFGGLRRAECAAIKLQDITLKQEHHVLTVQSGKGGKRRDIPLRPEMFRAITIYLQAVERENDSPDSLLFTGFYKGQKSTHRGITDRQIANIVKGYAQGAGITATPHDLRASAITYWIDTGAPIIQAQRLAGHSSPVTTERYYSRKQDLDNSPVYRMSLED